MEVIFDFDDPLLLPLQTLLLLLLLEIEHIHCLWILGDIFQVEVELFVHVERAAMFYVIVVHAIANTVVNTSENK